MKNADRHRAFTRRAKSHAREELLWLAINSLRVLAQMEKPTDATERQVLRLAVGSVLALRPFPTRASSPLRAMAYAEIVVCPDGTEPLITSSGASALFRRLFLLRLPDGALHSAAPEMTNPAQ
jgi:hypothetical protein